MPLVVHFIYSISYILKHMHIKYEKLEMPTQELLEQSDKKTESNPNFFLYLCVSLALGISLVIIEHLMHNIY